MKQVSNRKTKIRFHRDQMKIDLITRFLSNALTKCSAPDVRILFFARFNVCNVYFKEEKKPFRAREKYRIFFDLNLKKSKKLPSFC